MSVASGASILARGLGALGAIAALGAGGLGIAGIAAPVSEIALGGGLLALLAALLPGARAAGTDNSDSARPMAVPRQSPPAAAPPSDELRRLRAEVERYKKLEEQLTQAKQAAEAAVMAKGEFLATMSHEIRTPLNGIIPLLDILMSSPLQADQRDYVQTAFGSAKQLLRIVDDILDYSKLEANKLTLESVGLNLRDSLDGVMRLLEKSAEAKGLGFSLTIDPAVRLPVRGDPVRLRQVLTNLISNAIKFTERGKVSVHLIRRGETRNHHELRFEVRDTGVGITPEAAATLFKPFSQADTSTTREFGGTGLGLVICKRIVDLMGGQIGVDSQPGQGSTFWFHVPMLKAVGDMGSREQGLQDAKIMVLSGDPAQQRRFAVAIPNWGAKPTPASNTQEALTKLRSAAARGDNWAIDILIVDLPSVRTTFIALHRALQREPELASLKAVFLQGGDPMPPELQAGERVMIAQRGASEGELRRLLERFVSEAAPANPMGTEAEINVSPANPAPIDAAPAAEGARTETSKLSGHMLLVEDNPVNRQVAQRLLTLAGLTLDAAENGQEALDLLERNRYDAVLMDCQMPVLDGYSATQRRRAAETARGLPRIPIIAMTANAMVGDREKCIAAGMDDYLSKPINRGMLMATLQRWLPAPADATSPGEPIRPRLAAVPTAPLPRAAAPALPTPPGPRPAIAASAAAAARPAESAPPAKPAAPAITLEVVEDLRDIMGAEFDALVAVFLEDAPKSLKRLEEAAAAGDNDALVGPAHSLKSTSANLGAMELSAQAKHIEYGARQKTLVDPARLVNSLVMEFRRAETELRRLLH